MPEIRRLCNSSYLPKHAEILNSSVHVYVYIYIFPSFIYIVVKLIPVLRAPGLIGILQSIWFF